MKPSFLSFLSFFLIELRELKELKLFGVLKISSAGFKLRDLSSSGFLSTLSAFLLGSSLLSLFFPSFSLISFSLMFLPFSTSVSLLFGLASCFFASFVSSLISFLLSSSFFFLESTGFVSFSDSAILFSCSVSLLTSSSFVISESFETSDFNCASPFESLFSRCTFTFASKGVLVFSGSGFF